MDHRGHAWRDSGHQSNRNKDREGFSRYYQQEQTYMPPDPRERGRHWGPPDARYRTHFSSPPPTLEQFPYNTQHHLYGYGHQNPQSRYGYDYPPYSQWDSYAYYGYYRGQDGQQDGGQWSLQDSWRTDQYHERTQQQEHTGSHHTEDDRYEQRRGSSQHYLSDYEDHPSRDNEEISSYNLGTLESSKNSGLSSSSYELSQYMNGAEHTDPAHTSDGEHERGRQISVPLKYSIPHAVVSFGPAGQLVRVTPRLSTQENVSQLEVHSLEVILSETQEQQEMRNFPGPLTREDLHKVDAIEFAHQRAGACLREDKLPDRRSAALLWNLLILLCRQNGQIVGSDIAELLMQGSHAHGSLESEAPTLIDFNEEATSEAPPREGEELLTGNWSSFTSETSEKALQSYTQLLLAGRKKEALESAMTSGLWGHALFLASKMDTRSYTTVLNRFTSQLTPSDPLQTLFQLLSGRIPAVATCCGNEKWGDWRPHLAVMLSNETGDPAIQQKAIITTGDTLASRGLMHAAHVCYLTASVPFGVFTQKAERLVLLGSSHRQSFEDFASNSAIQCTELYEYCQTLRGKCFSIPSFQVYKFLYASRLLDCGLSSQAFHYCEVIAQAILRQREPFFVLTGEVIKLSDRLRFSEGQYSEAGFGSTEQEPDWLKHLRARHYSLQIGNYDCSETYQPTPSSPAPTHEDSNICSGSGSDSDLEDINQDVHSPQPELLYSRGTEDQQSFEHLARGDFDDMLRGAGGAQNWPPASSPSVPVMVACAPPAATVAGSQNSSYHNTDSTEVKSVSAYCPTSYLPSAAGETETPSGPSMILQPNLPTSLETSDQTSEPPKQNTKAGWFSGWFKSKTKDAPKENSDQGPPAQTEPSPTATPWAPTPPAAVPPGIFPPQPSSPGINPFSRKAGQQLG